ncbi:glycine/betaine ABC transporter substrate-binding protein [Phytoactinopolyspora sp. XMNu-373]|uniref:Glycine/betaine ABC transporter substrate-binding protein n=2 Tax=Phytoactinopolyspora mesophila TaxID=2650750 RepID=A0A7K3M4I3_9ACTN|nr:glycine/betaine ABC transporter substrate-binding protein [Phytoactinopolyspora mesophila]
MQSTGIAGPLSSGKLRIAAPLAVIGLLTSGCFGDSDSQGGAEPGRLAENVSLDDAKFTVGSKEFTEQLILCEITAIALQSVGADIERQCGLAGSDTTRTALTSGNIDMYWEYTGTAWISYLQHTEPVDGPDEQHRAVAEEDEADNDIVWLDYAPFNNTYAIAAADGIIEEYGVTTLSDYADLANSDPAAASLCVNSEFSVRNDGLPGVQESYGFEMASNNLATLEEGSIYNAIGKSDPCNFGMVATTDGRIQGLGLTVLEDDNGFFPVYNPAVTVRKPVIDEHPELAEVLNPIAAALSTEAMQQLNSEVDIDGERVEDVAREWLRSHGFVGD